MLHIVLFKLETQGVQVDEGDNPLSAIKKELLEETGFLYKNIKKQYCNLLFDD